MATKRKLRKKIKNWKREAECLEQLLFNAHQGAQERLKAGTLIKAIWVSDRDKLGQQTKQRLFAALKLLGIEVEV